jgi:hypothetical protein
MKGCSLDSVEQESKTNGNIKDRCCRNYPRDELKEKQKSLVTKKPLIVKLALDLQLRISISDILFPAENGQFQDRDISRPIL